VSYSWQAVAAVAGGDPQSVAADVPEEERRRLEEVADLLVPEADGMPAASAVGVGRKQLDAVLRSRPDLVDPLRKALRRDVDADINDWMARLSTEDPLAHHALTTVVLAGYYLSDEVRRLLDYPGQQASVVTIGYPEYVMEGLLDGVLERGPRYRKPPDG
jgi:hypothetical protein